MASLYTTHFPIGGQWWSWIYLAQIQRYGASKILGLRVWPFGVTWRHRSRDHRTRRGHFPIGDDDHAPTLHGYGDTGLQRFWGHEFDLLGSRDVIGHITWPLDSAHVISYWWSNETKRLSRTVTVILGPKDNGVTSLTFWGHVTSSVTWPFDSAYVVFY